ncbi:MAG: hypothetical protein JSU63_04915 [Phycisphaerales bacterium]|nr:MAG: hypothetical protein JSU63_04915 [Phycisphaerales bacterium]
MKLNRKNRPSVLLLGAMLLIVGATARADVGPPAVVKMPHDTPQATSGEVYAGVFEIHVFEASVLADFKLEGEGWTILSFDAPVDRGLAEVGTLRVPFRALPQDADRPIRLSFRCDGRRVTKEYELGPKYFGRVGKPRALQSTGVRLGDKLSVPVPVDASQADTSKRGGAVPLQFSGRLVYTRPCRDRSWPRDGDCDDPEDIPQRTVGADNIWVEVMDDDGAAGDPLVDESIWSFRTDKNGYFNSPIVWWDDCDVVGCDEPDIYVRFECDTGVGQVQDPGVMEEDYFWWTMDNIIENFTGETVNFGTMSPPGDEMPALHIWNSLVRAHRFIDDAIGLDVDHVDIQWPETGISTSQYSEDFDEIYIIAEDQWSEGTLIHEYGHHFLAEHSVNTAPDYCNDFCDGEEYCTSGTDCEDEGHCWWCRETDHDAWNEGFPNWLGYVIPSSFPDRYQHDDCTPFIPWDPYGFETTKTCCQDSQSHDPWLTEGFVAALLRDIADEKDDDHDEDDNDDNGLGSTTDCMELGAEEILTVAVVDQPTTPAGFIASFRSRYPEHTPGLWKTALNVNPDYSSAFPTDTAPPGRITVLDSVTHPSGVGGPLPCITVEFEQPTDDVTGTAGFSFEWTTDPGGVVPGTGPNHWYGGCTSRVWSGARDFGEHYISIRARDFEHHWGPHETFGPFVITGDCNSNGIIDLCDIECDNMEHTRADGIKCEVNTSFCDVTGCGLSDDCNNNLVPDECDLASGTSKDCDRNGVPDECDAAAGKLIQWADGDGSWHNPNNWYKFSECPVPPPPPTCDSPFQAYCPAVPDHADNVCINNAYDDITVTYGDGYTDIDILACNESLDVSGGSFPATLHLFKPSWVDGDLGLSGSNTVLDVYDRLEIGGLFTWGASGRLTGPGETYAHGGVQTSNMVYLDEHHLILDNNSTSVGTARVEFVGASVFEIWPGSSYEHQGGRYFLNGYFDDLFVNGGTLIKSVDPGESVIYMYTNNSGLIHVKAGTLKFYLGGSHAGDFLADPGTLLNFTGGHDFLSSSSIVAENILISSGIGAWNHVRGMYNVSVATTVRDHQTLIFTDEANIISYGSSFYIVKGTVDFGGSIVDDAIRFDTLQVGPGGGSHTGTADFSSGDPVQVTTLNLGPGSITCPSTITIDGLLTWNTAGHFSGPGTINANGDVLVNPAGGEKTLRDCVFNNAGTATLLGQFTMAHGTVVFNNLATGVIDIQADSGSSGSIISGLGQTLNNAGTLVKSAGAGMSTIAVPTTNTGTVEIKTGVLRFYTHYSGYYTQTAGQTILNGGDLFMMGPAPVSIIGGLLTGDGTITGNVIIYSEGTAAPGLSKGVLDVVGNYTQVAGGVLEIEIDGLNQGTEYDLVTVSGTASLAGSLEVVLPSSGFAPIPGDSFEVLSAGSVTGEFDPVNVPNLSPYLSMEVVYATDAVTLDMVGVVPGDCTLDGNADLDDYAELETCLLGPGGGVDTGCRCFDFDKSGDVDLGDFAVFQRLFTGS